tara:strand:- start:23135 stop:23818 length:684 start_codon:yes stop_codon:yes gene_type:complete
MRIRSSILSLTVLSSTLILGGCGYSMQSSNQDITFLSSDVQDAKCLVSVDNRTYHVRPPQTVSIKSSANDMKVKCTAEGSKDVELVIAAKNEKRAIWGAPAGKAWNYTSESLNNYPDVVTIDFSRVEVAPVASSELYNEDMMQPELQDLEEFSYVEPNQSDSEAVLMHKSDEAPHVDSQNEAHTAMEPNKGDLQAVLENLRATPTDVLKAEETESADSTPVELFPGQ